MLLANGIIFKVEEQQGALPEIISEETFINLLEMQHQAEDTISTDIMDKGWEDDDLDEDDLQFI